jgi:hypothetical protein
MTSLPPPPPVLAFGAPPPPDGLLPPFPAVGSVPPPPFPAVVPPPPPLLKTGGPPSSRIPFTPTVLLTKVPPFLHTFRAARDWLFPCGGVRSVTFYPRRQEDDDGDPIDLPSDARISLLVTFSHPDGACKLVGAFKHFASRLDDRYNGLQAFMVPANKDVPLPPPLLDEDSQQHLGEKLWQNFVGAESPDLHGGEATKEGGHVPLDSEKVAAAAGGNNYDADEDPLNAPAVLDAVKEFRRKLTKTQSFQKKKRMELVTRKVAEMRPRIKELVEEEKKRGPPLPPPPPMGGLLPPPPPVMAGMVPATATDGVGAPGDSGKRGRSNLPAWMTTTTNTTTGNNDEEEDGAEPSSKRVKTMEDVPTHFPPLPETTHAPFKDFLANQVQEALGEKEDELITFLHSHVLAGGSSAEMLEELKMVLEDEAGPFLEAVWNRVNELLA